MRYHTLVLSMICMLLSANSAMADKRIAFVVGNGAYKNVAQLPNPPVDAKAMAGVLRNVGFEVVEGVNLTRDKMTEKLLDFGKRAQGADIAVFYYAGHGIAIDGANYLLPIDADVKSEMDVKLGAASMSILRSTRPWEMRRSSWCFWMPAATILSRPGSRPPRHGACRFSRASPR